MKINHWRPWFGLVLAVALAQRAWLWLMYPPGLSHGALPRNCPLGTAWMDGSNGSDKNTSAVL